MSSLWENSKSIFIFMLALMTIKFIIAIHNQTDGSVIVGYFAGAVIAAIMLTIPVVIITELIERLINNKY